MNYPITSISQFESIVNWLSSQGFYTYEKHRVISEKIKQLIDQSNTFDLIINQSEIARSLGLEKLNNFGLMVEKIESYFASYTIKDKINQLLDSISLVDYYDRQTSKRIIKLPKKHLHFNSFEHSFYHLTKLINILDSKTNIVFNRNHDNGWNEISKGYFLKRFCNCSYQMKFPTEILKQLKALIKEHHKKYEHYQIIEL